MSEPPIESQNAEGQALRRLAQGPKSDRILEALSELDPQLAEWADSWIFGEVWARPGLEHEDRMIVAITALAAQGNTAQLRTYLHGALEAGISARKIHESLVMLVVYVGFPTVVGVLGVWSEIVASARRNGLTVDL